MKNRNLIAPLIISAIIFAVTLSAIFYKIVLNGEDLTYEGIHDFNVSTNQDFYVGVEGDYIFTISFHEINGDLNFELKTFNGSYYRYFRNQGNQITAPVFKDESGNFFVAKSNEKCSTAKAKIDYEVYTQSHVEFFAFHIGFILGGIGLIISLVRLKIYGLRHTTEKAVYIDKVKTIENNIFDDEIKSEDINKSQTSTDDDALAKAWMQIIDGGKENKHKYH